ncbi:complement component 1 Q subcomponent-binding protein, mitochondrial [Dendrobates tinctorius]|uniref:complement component 1 Q subcomponent-binding protein, mitochondrial n=1 Tax=Dendrobates tinctorius TaxID=92724 RepID=UPI003CC956C7
MFSSLSRSLITAAARVVVARPLPLLSSQGPARALTRSLWLHGGASSTLRPTFLNPYRGFPAVSCGCGGLHTDGDKAFSEFLNDEIKEEKKILKHKNLPKMSGGWELEVNGTEAKLTKKVSGEKVTVTFNTNNSIPPSYDEEPQEGQKGGDEEPDLVSTPNFVVEVTKLESNQTLVLDCHYPADEVGHGEEEEESDIFTIREVSFQPTGDTDWKENSYTLTTDSLDWALYDHLMDFLSDRGIDNTFADELIELSTGLEHQEYIRFLENLNSFVKC